jgi:hypothetical protein
MLIDDPVGAERLLIDGALDETVIEESDGSGAEEA